VIRRTWPYGTRKTVTVRQIVGVWVVCFERESTEHFALTGVDHAGVSAGDERTIEFREGGPTGGHWDFVAERS